MDARHPRHEHLRPAHRLLRGAGDGEKKEKTSYEK